MGNLFIVTGASGTGVTTSLTRYCREHGGQIVKLETHLADVAKPYLDQQEATMRDVVMLPPAILRTLWPEACESAISVGSDAGEPVKELLEKGDVFLTFHAAWYHLLSTSFVSAVDMGTLNSQIGVELDHSPRIVITLIDDIYDMLARLIRPHQVFERGLSDNDNPISAVCSLLLKILAWREFEVRYSQQVSASLMGELPHVLFAVKHPLTTFAKLVQSETPRRVYLSHPISEPRRLGLDEEDGQRLMSFFADVAAGLRAGSDFVLIEPTAIDELRLDLAAEGVPLRGRWIPPRDLEGRELEQLWDGLVRPHGTDEETAADRAFAAQPFLEAIKHAENRRARQPTAIVKEMTAGEATAAASELVRVLDAEIDCQVNWRDRQLVSESHGLVVVRPFAKESGAHSKSVGREMDMYLRLREFERERKQIVRISATVYHPRQDERRRQRMATLEVLRQYGADGVIENLSQDSRDRLKDLLPRDLEAWLELDATEVGRRLSDVFLKLPEPSRPGLVVPGGRGLEAGKKFWGGDVERRIGEGVINAITGAEVPSHPTHSLKPFIPDNINDVNMITEDYDASDLAEHLSDVLTLIDRLDTDNADGEAEFGED